MLLSFYASDVFYQLYKNSKDKNIKESNEVKYIDNKINSDKPEYLGYITKYTIFTIATLDWYMTSKHSTKELMRILKKYHDTFDDTSDRIFGRDFNHWFNRGANYYRVDYKPTCATWCSILGYCIKDMRQLKRIVARIVKATNNTDTALKASELATIVVYLSRKNYSKEKLLRYLQKSYNFKPIENFLEIIDNQEWYKLDINNYVDMALNCLFSCSTTSETKKLCAKLIDLSPAISILAYIFSEAYNTIDNKNFLSYTRCALPYKYTLTLIDYDDYILPIRQHR